MMYSVTCKIYDFSTLTFVNRHSYFVNRFWNKSESLDANWYNILFIILLSIFNSSHYKKIFKNTNPLIPDLIGDRIIRVNPWSPG